MPSYEDILKELNELLQPLAEKEKGQTLNEETELVADLGLDSVQVMELLLQIEDCFDISIPLNVLPDVRTVKDLALQIHRMIEQP